MKWFLRPLIFLCYVLATLCLAVLMLIGYALTFLYRIVGQPVENNAINCFAYVIPKWLFAGTGKSYIIIRMSKHTVVPHIFFAKSIRGVHMEEFRPLEPRPGWRGFFHSFWHKGRIRKGEGEERK